MASSADFQRRQKINNNIVFQLHISLRKIRPLIWRRLLIDGTSTLDDLHHIIQCAMGWLDLYHYSFCHKGFRYDTSRLLKSKRTASASNPTNIPLAAMGLQPKDLLLYSYALDECWEHDILVEHIQKKEPATFYPCCLGGERACPPEECGGVEGYEKIILAFKERDNPQLIDMYEWIPKDYDPEFFDIEKTNKELQTFLAESA